MFYARVGCENIREKKEKEKKKNRKVDHLLYTPGHPLVALTHSNRSARAAANFVRFYTAVIGTYYCYYYVFHSLFGIFRQVGQGRLAYAIFFHKTPLISISLSNWKQRCDIIICAQLTPNIIIRYLLNYYYCKTPRLPQQFDVISNTFKINLTQFTKKIIIIISF